ncbi:uncharacterized protein LOC126660192 isoform X2 [Mercurialis annua]|uniref:uncharacterized protein LOC126660192 isoform X2 n=1 Tax=Mercurialis annua TaxID=3986 RepID=UPI00215FED56|nr:uncharacterized protein LOC126660192 isoform X2 [Mercurialis annua]
MGWILIFLSLIVLWIASLCKILHVSNSAYKTSFLNGSKKNVLLVIAHPDDESMFFSPTINYLISRGHNVHILCLSIGNADGIGNTRKHELYQACAVLKVPLQQVKVLDHPKLQDGFGQVWDHSLLENIIEEEVSGHNINVVITFDNYGISGHCNHRDVHYGILKLLNGNRQANIETWELVSTNILRKYSGPIDIWLSMLKTMKYKSEETYCLLNEHPQKTLYAMAAHSSQWVWFRKLFVAFSSYTYVNSLKRIKLAGGLCRNSLIYVGLPEGLNRVLPLQPLAHMKPALSTGTLSSPSTKDTPFFKQLSSSPSTDVSIRSGILVHLSEGESLNTYDLSVGSPTPYEQYISISGASGLLISSAIPCEK